MGRNWVPKYKVKCECGWTGIRAAIIKPCPRCGLWYPIKKLRTKKMIKYCVEEIKTEAKNTLNSPFVKGKKGDELPERPISIGTIRDVSRKVLFLCKRIEKLTEDKDNGNNT